MDHFRLNRDKGTIRTAAAATVASTATAIVAANARRAVARIFNNGSQTVFLGDAGVTVATGVPLYPGRWATDEDSQGPIYGIVTSGTADVRAYEVC